MKKDRAEENEPERFEDFVRKVIAVPKSELVEQDRYHRRRKSRSKQRTSKRCAGTP